MRFFVISQAELQEYFQHPSGCGCAMCVAIDSASHWLEPFFVVADINSYRW